MNFDELFSLKGKTALVTGAAYGIGFAIAEALAAAGADIAFCCRSKEHLKKALDGYAADGISARGFICDVTDEAQRDFREDMHTFCKKRGAGYITVSTDTAIERVLFGEFLKAGIMS